MEQKGAMVQGRSMASVDKVTDKPEKYAKFMKLDDILDMFCKLRLNKDAV